MVSAPDLNKYVNRKVLVQLNGSRVVTGVLKGYDMFLNITLEGGKSGADTLGSVVVRGSSIVSVELVS